MLDARVDVANGIAIGEDTTYPDTTVGAGVVCEIVVGGEQ